MAADISRSLATAGLDSYAPAQFWIEFGSNRSDNVCGIVLREAADEKHLISQREASRHVFRKHSAGSRSRER